MTDNVSKRNLFFILVFFSFVFMFWQVWSGQETTNLLHQWPVIGILISLTSVLFWWIPNPIPKDMGEESVNKSRYGILVLLFLFVLFILPVLIGGQLLWFLPILGITILLVMRPRLKSKEILYALFLSLTASISAFFAGWISQFSPMIWSILQFLLVITGCITGWHLIHHSGLERLGIGLSSALDKGFGKALRQFVIGFLIGLPWALGLVLLGGARTEMWVQAWWHPFIAIQPAIAEEAWGRLLLVPFVYQLMRLMYKPRIAFTAALIIVGYWFAFLHTVGTQNILINTLFIGTLYVLPTSYLCLYKDFETAVGFHFCIDFIKFVSAYFIMNGN